MLSSLVPWLADALVILGLLVMTIENDRSDFIWGLMRQSPVIRRGLQRGGFTGGWLDEEDVERKIA